MFLKSSVSLKQEIKCSRIIDFIRILYTVENMESYIRSAMSYTNVTDIEHFCPEFVDCVVISKNTQESVNK